MKRYILFGLFAMPFLLELFRAATFSPKLIGLVMERQINVDILWVLIELLEQPSAL